MYDKYDERYSGIAVRIYEYTRNCSPFRDSRFHVFCLLLYLSLIERSISSENHVLYSVSALLFVLSRKITLHGLHIHELVFIRNGGT